ncbi:MAG: hypothetical protein CMF22_11280 [Idiomarinaceae bacterium]|nr:hypothetical protein [Idiomarinaceae bacterium]|tara:strand:- start:130008 stop:130349 length:342 start_codon:yes stop_codon:yes gene_type:complete
MATLKSRIRGLTSVIFSDGSSVYLIRGQTVEFNEAEKEPVHIPDGVEFTPDHVTPVPHIEDIPEYEPVSISEPREEVDQYDGTPEEENASESLTEDEEDVSYDLVDLTEHKGK